MERPGAGSSSRRGSQALGAVAMLSAGTGGLIALWGLHRDALILYAIASLTLLAIAEWETRPPSRAGAPGIPLLIWSLCIVGAFLVYHYHALEDSHIPILDNLDGILPLYKLLAERPLFEGLDAVVPAILDGLPRNSGHSEFKLYPLLFRVVPPIWAYILNDAAIRLVGLLGMALLLGRRVAPDVPRWIVAGAATSFALLPHLPAGCLSVAGLPLLADAILELRLRPRSGASWAVVTLFPLCSMLPLIGWVVLLVLAAWIALDLIHGRGWTPSTVRAAAVLAVLYVATDYRALYQILFDADYVSHRIEFGASPSFSQTGLQLLHRTTDHFRMGFPHAASLHDPILLGAVFGGLALVALARAVPLLRSASQRDSGSGRDRRAARRIAAALGLIAVLSALSALSFHEPFQRWVAGSSFGVLKTLHLSRVAWVEPLLWYACFALVLDLVARRLRGGVPLAAGLIALQLAIPFFCYEFYEQRKELPLSYREFFSPELFREIRDHVGRPQRSYRVVSIGLPPGVASYNGFYTLDGYVSNYPLEYKHRFRRLIAAELAKSPRHRRRFDEWGSHCFLYVAELPQPLSQLDYFGHTRNARPRRIRRLELDREAMEDLGLDYVLSAVRIANHRANGLVPRGVFERDDSPWRIFLYERAQGPPAL